MAMTECCRRCWSADHDTTRCPWADLSSKALREERQQSHMTVEPEPRKWEYPVSDTEARSDRD
jgi:hypothetical protein